MEHPLQPGCRPEKWDEELTPTSHPLLRSLADPGYVGLSAGALRDGGHALDVVKQEEQALLIHFSSKAVDVAVVHTRGTFCSYSLIILAL